MTSKVLVKLPVVPFSQRKKPLEIIPLSSRNDENDGRFQGHNIDKVTQLEQNMKFLQDQHQITLIALHQEVEALRQKNRDLQFQLVFSKEANNNSNIPSYPDENEIESTKTKVNSASSINITPLQVELLEKDLKDIKINLEEAKMRNSHLSEVIEKLKKSLESSEKSKEKQKLTHIGTQVDGVLESQQTELQARLDDAKVLVKKLLQKNMDQFEEIATMKSAVSYPNGNIHKSGNKLSRKYQQGPNHGFMNKVQAQEENYHKFPLLQPKNYWHRVSRGNNSCDNKTYSGYRRNRHHQQRQDLEPEAGNTVLPQLQSGTVRIGKSSSYSYNFKSGLHNGGHCYAEDRSNRKYRGQKLQRDHRDQRNQDTREYHKECKYREAKENQRQQRECLESPKESRNCTTIQRQ